MKKGLLIWAIAAASLQAEGQNFQVNPQGIRNMAMGGAGTALTWNADVLYHNPAGMADLNLWEISLSGQLRYRSAEYGSAGYATETKRAFDKPFSLYAAGPISRAKERIAVGVGIYTPYSNYVSWDDRWPGRYIVQQSSLQTLFAQPTVSYKFNRNFAVGVGYVFAFAQTQFRQTMAAPGPNGNESTRELKSQPWGRGFNAGVYYKLNKWIQLGLNYKSQLKLYTDQGTAAHNVETSLRDSFPDTKFSTEIRMPHTGSFGIGYRPSYRLTLQADVSYSFVPDKDSTLINFAQNSALLEDIRIAQRYRNAFSYRLGVNYAFSDKLAVMAGGAWEESGIDPRYISPEHPDDDKIRATAGVFYRPAEKISLILALNYLLIPNFGGYYLPANFGGDYKLQNMSAGLGLSLDF